MPEPPKNGNNAVYKVDQTTGKSVYVGQYGGKGGQAIRNTVRTVGARQAARARRAGL